MTLDNLMIQALMEQDYVVRSYVCNVTANASLSVVWEDLNAMINNDLIHGSSSLDGLEPLDDADGLWNTNISSDEYAHHQKQGEHKVDKRTLSDAYDRAMRGIG